VPAEPAEPAEPVLEPDVSVVPVAEVPVAPELDMPDAPEFMPLPLEVAPEDELPLASLPPPIELHAARLMAISAPISAPWYFFMIRSYWWKVQSSWRCNHAFKIG
jgi:hypothetical protein